MIKQNTTTDMPTVLLVEPNPYHGEILPGFTYLFQELGYKVELLIRNEVAFQKPFAIYPKDRLPLIHTGSAERLKKYLYSIEEGKYEIILFTTNVYWEKDKNNTSYLRYLKFLPKANLGSLFVEHNLWSIDNDDSSLIYKANRLFTLLEYPYRGSKTKMLNPHYFGELKTTESRDLNRILLLGSSSYSSSNIKLLFQAVRKVKEISNKPISISITGADVDVPSDLRDEIKTLGFLNFPEFYQIIENHDYLLTVFDSKSSSPEQNKYKHGTTSGTIQLSLGFNKPIIINDTNALAYGFSEKDSITYKNNNLFNGLKNALEMNQLKYEDIVNNLKIKSRNIEKTSLHNLAKAIKDLKNSKNNELSISNILGIKTRDALNSYAVAKDLKLKNKNLKQELTEITAQELLYQEEMNIFTTEIENLKIQINYLHKPILRKLADGLNATKNKTHKKSLNILRKTLLKISNIKENYNLEKQAKEIKESELFDESYYLALNHDVASSGIDPAKHYLKYGSSANNQPGPLFDQAYYLSRYLDVRYSTMNPLLHYIRYGKAEGRSFSLEVNTDPIDVRPAIVFQLDSFDKGGLEEVVLMLSNDQQINKTFKVYVFVSGSKDGYLAKLAESRGVHVLDLNHNTIYLDYLIVKLDIKLVNMHYSIFGAGIYKKYKVKLVYTVHNNYIWADAQFINSRFLVYRVVDKFIVVSDQVGKFFAKKFDISEPKILTITNGINPYKEYIEPQNRSTYGLKNSDFVFINVASFTPNKYHVAAIVAFSKVVKDFPEAKMLLVGNVLDHEYFKIVKEMITKYRVNKNVKIIDYMPKGKILGLLDISDCFVMTSLTEGFSIASLEALYHNLPLILTDVGGARHLIHKNDLGIVVNNSYKDIQLLSNDKIKKLYIDDSHLNNLKELTAAMKTIIYSKDKWKRKAKKGREKVEREFLTKYVAKNYVNEFESLIYEELDFERKLARAIEDVKIAFFAPYPSKDRIKEGWMSRIRAIDSIIGNQNKIYINISPDNQRPKINKYGRDEWELTIGRESIYYGRSVNAVISKVKIAYVHTLHLAEYALPWLESGKIIVDIHGITPEEEIMLGRGYLKDRYEAIEQKVLSNAKVCVMVTHAMADHYALKYKIKPNKVIILPIVEDTPIYKKKIVLAHDKKFQTVYSGGTQAWQNINDMIEIAKQTENIAKTTFLSHDWKYLKTIGKQLNAPVDAVYEFCSKKDLSKRYRQFDFGLVLRDDTSVNRVACPTKLYEYMISGIVPVVRLEDLGDFKRFGYKYVTEDNYKKNNLPNSEIMHEIINKNYQTVLKMKKTFIKGSNQLRKEIQ